MFLIITALPASAGDGRWAFTADLSIEIEDEYVFRSSEPEGEFNDAFSTLESELTLVSPGGAGLYALAALEPVTDAAGDRFFDDLGLYLEELHMVLPAGASRVRIGKLNSDFGLANDAAPGIYGDDLAGDYELTERIGLAISWPFTAVGGEHEVSATAFAADTSVLSDSLFTRRGRLRRHDGGVSNTEAPESFALSVAGAIGDKGYNLGLRRQRRGTGDDSDEYGGVVAFTRIFDLDGTEVSVLGEIAHFPDFDGGHESASFLTVGTEAVLGELALSVVVGRRKTEDSPAEDLITATIEYELFDGVSFAIGYRYLEEEGERSHTAGILLTYDIGLF